MRCCCIALVLCISSMSIADHPYVERIQSMIENKTVRIAMVKNGQAPFFQYDKHLNIDQMPYADYIDIHIARLIRNEVRELAKSDDIELKIHWVNTFDGVVEAVASNEADMGISKLSRTVKRSARVLFSDPYLQLRMALIVNTSHLAKLDIEQSFPTFLRQLRKEPENMKRRTPFFLGVLKGSSYEHVAMEWFPDERVKHFADWKEAVRALENGEIHALFRDEFEIQKLFRLFPHLSIRYKPVYLNDTKDEIAIAVPAGHPTFCFWVNQLMRESNTSGVAKGAIKRHLATIDGKNSIKRLDEWLTP